MDEALNTVNAVQEPAVGAHETSNGGYDGVTAEHSSRYTQDNTESRAQNTAGGEGYIGDAMQQELAKPAQSPEQNAQYAKMRREAEQHAQQKAAELAQQKIDEHYHNMFAGQVNPYTGEQISSEADFTQYLQQQKIAEMSQQSGLSYEQQQYLQEAVLSSPEYIKVSQEAQTAKQHAGFFKELIIDGRMKEDLSKIKAYNPKETAASLEDFGETYANCISMGMDAITAYDIFNAERQRQNKRPPTMGDINSSGNSEGDYYTIDQLKGMSQTDMRKHWAKVEKSKKYLFK